MLQSFVDWLAGMVLPMNAGIIAWPARVLLGFMLQVSSLLSKVPHALAKAGIGAVIMVAMYGMVVVICAMLYKKTPQSVTMTLD